MSARHRRDIGVAFVADPLDLTSRDDVDIIVELIGGADGIAHDLIARALDNGKHVVTANKALLAAHGMALAKRAEANGLALNYEAAIASGVPIVKILRESLAGIDITRISGILNGTSNYILSHMAEDGVSFAEALADAQRLGYAEADPHLDISGEDAAHKLSLLMRLAFGAAPAHIPTSGIETIDSIDIQLAHHMGYAIKLIAYAEARRGAVCPMLVPLTSKLAQSVGTDNVIRLESRSSHLCLEGEGAGAEPTANSVIADIIDIARDIHLPVFGRPVAELTADAAPSPPPPAAFYLRAFAVDRPGSMAAIANMMAACDISLAGIHQPELAHAGSAAPIALITHPIGADKIAAALAALAQSSPSRRARQRPHRPLTEFP